MKKGLVLGLVMLLVVGSVTGCVSNTTTSTSTEMGKVNGVSVTREMLGDKLKQAEKGIVEEYINDYLLDEFYKGVEVTDVEVEAQLAIIKGQVGEQQWPQYLAYVGYASDDAFKEELKLNLKREKKMKEFEKDLNITDEEVKAAYDKEPDLYNVMVLDVVFCNTDDEFAKAQAALKDGKSLEDIAKAAGVEVRPNEHINFQTELFDKELKNLKVGDKVTTNEASGSKAIAEVKKISNTFEAVKEEVKKNLIATKTDEKVTEALDAFYAKADVTILGEKQEKPADK